MHDHVTMSGVPSGSPLPSWLDDGPATADGGTVSALDAGLRSGWGVFETMRAHGTATLGLDAHLARLAAGAVRLGIPADPARIRDALVRTLSAPREVHEVVARITLTAGPVDADSWPSQPVGRPTLAITLHPAPPLPLPPVVAASVVARRWPADVKTTSYAASILATREARAAGGEVAVLTDGDELLETAEGNLLALVDGALVTPPADGRLLPGVLRALVLEEAARAGVPVREAQLLRTDAQRADVLIVTSAVVELRTLRRLDAVDIAGSGHAGVPVHPVVEMLRGALGARRTAGG